MVRALRQPKWIIATILVAMIAGVFIRLGFWQLDRRQTKQEMNAIGSARINADPVSLTSLLEETDGDLSSIEFRRVFVTGAYDPAEEVLIRSQVERGQAGFHVVTPLVLDQSDLGVLVNRGWVPLSMDQPPVEAAPEPGRTRVEGWVELTEMRPPLGPEDLPGELGVFNRVDIGRVGEQTEYNLAPVYVVETGERTTDLPIPVRQPDFTDEGPHLAYAIQWFGFAIVLIVGFYFLFRRRTSPRGDRSRRY